MAKKSAGLLLYRRGEKGVEVYLAHPGGPFWKNKEAHAWSIPKGEFEEEAPLDAAKREFREETGLEPPRGAYAELEPVRQSGGKTVHAFALHAEMPAGEVQGNTFSMEWPPNSGREQKYREVDRTAWFDLATAREKINKGQAALLDQVAELAR